MMIATDETMLQLNRKRPIRTKKFRILAHLTIIKSDIYGFYP